MNERLSGIRHRRDELQARIAAQRGHLAEAGECLRAPLALADRGISLYRFVRGHPWLVAGAASVLVLRRRGMTGLLRSAWRLWKNWRLLNALSRKLAGRATG